MKEQRSVTPDDREAVPMRPAAEDPKPDESLFRDTCFSPEDLMEEQKEPLTPSSRNAFPSAAHSPPVEIKAKQEQPAEEPKPLYSKEPSSPERSESFVLESYNNSNVNESITPRPMDPPSPTVLPARQDEELEEEYSARIDLSNIRSEMEQEDEFFDMEVIPAQAKKVVQESACVRELQHRPQISQLSEDSFTSEIMAEVEIPFKLNDVKPKTQEQLQNRINKITANRAEKIKVDILHQKIGSEEVVDPPVKDTDEEEVKVGIVSKPISECEESVIQTWQGQVPINDPPIVAFPIAEGKDVVGFNIETGAKFSFQMKKMPYFFSTPEDSLSFIPWVFLNDQEVMFSGGIRRFEYQNHSYVYSFKTEYMCRKADLNEARIAHGVYRYNQSVYAFSGQNNYEPITSNEVYDIERDSWSNLPNLPIQQGILFATVACIGSNLYIAGQECDKIVTYKTAARRFSVFHVKLPREVANHKVISNGENLFIIELDKVYEYTAEGEEITSYNTNKGNIYEHWLAGPPIYYENKAYFSGNDSVNRNLYCFDFDNPTKGLYISHPKCFEASN